MMMKKIILIVIIMAPLAAAMLLVGGCSSAAAPAGQGIARLPVETLWASGQSNHNAPAPLALWVDDSSGFSALAQAAATRLAPTILEQHRIDWHDQGVVWLYMGLKNSGGYALNLAMPEAMVSRGIAVITVQWREPRPGAIVTQQLTSPCLVLKIPKGNYDEIVIQDETGRVRTRLALHHSK